MGFNDLRHRVAPVLLARSRDKAIQCFGRKRVGRQAFENCAVLVQTLVFCGV
jgi:hypothetical protein